MENWQADIIVAVIAAVPAFLVALAALLGVGRRLRTGNGLTIGAMVGSLYEKITRMDHRQQNIEQAINSLAECVNEHHENHEIHNFTKEETNDSH